jgi:hypothetical protein
MGIHDMNSATKLSLGAAALAMAGAAVVSPAVAQAADADCTGNTIECLFSANAGVDLVALATAGDTPTNPLVQNDAIWLQFDGINEAFANDAETVQVWTFNALTVAPFLAPIFVNNNQQSCFLGITTTLGGPYAEAGEYVHSYNRKGCNLGWTTA